MISKLEHSPKIVAPQLQPFYYSRDRLLNKVLSHRSKRLLLINAPAGYGKTSLSVEFFHHLKSDLKLWISISTYDRSLENFFLLLSMAFRKYLKSSSVGENIKKVLTGSQSSDIESKINLLISSFSDDVHNFLKRKKKRLYIFLDDFHNIDESHDVNRALDYFLDYLPENVHLVIITRRDPELLNYPKFLAKGWLGRITKSDLSFDSKDVSNFLKICKRKAPKISKDIVEEYLKGTEGWITAIRLLLLTGNPEIISKDDIAQSRSDIFEYFANEIFSHCSAEEKELMLVLSHADRYDRELIESVLRINNGFAILQSLFSRNTFIDREDNEFRFHELFHKFLKRLAGENFTADKKKDILNKLGIHFLSKGEWREEFIGLDYIIQAGNHAELKNWIKFNATDKLLLIHSSGLFDKIENVADQDFKTSLEYILLKVNTLIFRDKELDKALDYLKSVLRSRFRLSMDDGILLPSSRIGKQDLNYYVEILMLICNCNFLKEGISPENILISEHLLKFDLKVEQEIQFIVSLVKSYITSGENSKSGRHIERLKRIFEKIQKGEIDLRKETDENTFVESIFSLLIFFDYGDFKWGNDVVRFIDNNCDPKSFDISNYSQLCFALFASYNQHDFERFYLMLKQKNKEKGKTMFSAYRNQYEFQSILRKFLNFSFEETISDLELVRKKTFLKNYAYFIDSLILYSYCLLNHPRAVVRNLNEGKYKVSRTREIILRLEAGILLNDEEEFRKQMEQVELIGRENFTLFNQAVIVFYECYKFAVADDQAGFRKRFREFLKLCEDHEFDNYSLFRAKSNKLRFVFEFAASIGAGNEYAESIGIVKRMPFKESRSKIEINIRFLDHSKIFVNGRELTDNHWLRPKSKMIFLYCAYKTSTGEEITKEKIIDDMLYMARDVNYEVIVDVEVNKIRKTLNNFVREFSAEYNSKDFLILKDKKYSICSKSIDWVLTTDIDEFKKLASGNPNDMMKAIGMYKTDFVKDSYRNWAEDVRENLKFIYADTIHKLTTHYENSGDINTVISLLERLLELDFTDEEIMMKLLSLYNKEKDYRKFRYAYGIYEKRLKKEFDVQPSSEMKSFFDEVISQA